MTNRVRIERYAVVSGRWHIQYFHGRNHGVRRLIFTTKRRQVIIAVIPTGVRAARWER